MKDHKFEIVMFVNKSFIFKIEIKIQIKNNQNWMKF